MIGSFDREPTPTPDRISDFPLVGTIFQLATEPGSARVFDALSFQPHSVTFSELMREVNADSGERPIPGSLVSNLVNRYVILELAQRTTAVDPRQYRYSVTELGKNVHAILAAASNQMEVEMRARIFKVLQDNSEQNS